MQTDSGYMQTDGGLSGQDVLSVLEQLRPGIEDFGRVHYGASVVKAAWLDFSRWGKGAIDGEERDYQSAFAAWYLLSWLPDDESLTDDKFHSPASDHALGFDYLKANREQLGPLQQGVIESAVAAPYSFYSVVSVESDNRLQLKEIYTGQSVLVEGAMSERCTVGELLFTAVLSLNGVSVLLGCMPRALAPEYKVKVEAHREKWRAKEGESIDRRLLYLHDTELRRFYFVLLSQAQRATLH